MVGFIARRQPDAAATDLAAEVFRIAFERRADFEPAHPTARPWLYGIAANLLRSERRRSGRRDRAVRRLAGRASTDPLDFTLQVDRALDAGSVTPALREALQSLRDEDRAVLLLVAWDGLTYDEIAALQQVPVGTARSRAHRARQQLRAALEPPDDPTHRRGELT